MNLEALQKKLLASARANPPTDRVPYAFEQRIMARIREQPALDLATFWTRMLWRAAAPCVAITVVIAAWSQSGSYGTVATHEAGESTDFLNEFEQTMLAVVEEQGEEFW
jgi:hypothetical protein